MMQSQIHAFYTTYKHDYESLYMYFEFEMFEVDVYMSLEIRLNSLNSFHLPLLCRVASNQKLNFAIKIRRLSKIWFIPWRKEYLPSKRVFIKYGLFSRGKYQQAGQDLYFFVYTTSFFLLSPFFARPRGKISKSVRKKFRYWSQRSTYQFSALRVH